MSDKSGLPQDRSLIDRVTAMMTDPNLAPYIGRVPSGDWGLPQPQPAPQLGPTYPREIDSTVKVGWPNVVVSPPRHDKGTMGDIIASWELKSNEAEMRAAKAVNDKDTAYNERNRLVALLACLFPSGVLPDTTDPDWQIIYVDLPTGQASWHVPNAEMGLFEGLPAYTGKWDNHTTGEKHKRIEKLVGTLKNFDVNITPANLPEPEPEDEPVKPKGMGIKKPSHMQTVSSVMLAPGQTFSFDRPVVVRDLHVSMSTSPISSGATIEIMYEDV